jgi:hypothetical protein
MALAKKKSAPKKTKTTSLGNAQTVGVATAADVALAAKLAASARSADPDVSSNIVNLLRNADLVTSLRANAAAINEQGAGTVDATLARVADFLTRHQAAERLAVSLERVRASLTRDNADFTRFATAVSSVFTKAGKLSAIKSDVALKTFVSNREVQRGLPKMKRTKNKKSKAKKAAIAKTS